MSFKLRKLKQRVHSSKLIELYRMHWWSGNRLKQVPGDIDIYMRIRSSHWSFHQIVFVRDRSSFSQSIQTLIHLDILRFHHLNQFLSAFHNVVVEFTLLLNLIENHLCRMTRAHVKNVISTRAMWTKLPPMHFAVRSLSPGASSNGISVPKFVLAARAHRHSRYPRRCGSI